MKPAYNPMDYRARKRQQAIRTLNVKQSIGLYIWMIFWLSAVVWAWAWAFTPLRQILPDTR